ncbi:dTDP-4-dehydrorhamnose reductase [Candidatus Omnitrophota bacterium]
MRALITGAGGMLGNALVPLLSENGYEVFPTDIVILDPQTKYLDVRDPEAVKACVEKAGPKIIFHLAAETNVDKCETEVEHAYATNAQATKNIALICRERNITMVYISTCGVFDGRKATPYNEADTPNPISVYTKTKFEGEKIVKELLKEYFILRAGWMMGGGKNDKKFVAKIVELAKTRESLKVVDDKKGCPTFTKDFSEGLIKVIKKGDYGLYHVTNEGAATRYDIACKIIEYLGRKDVTVKPVSSAEFPLPAPRPDSEAVDCNKLARLNIRMRPWQDALRDYLKELTRED